VTLFALLEMHRHGEATWEQRQNFGPIRISKRMPDREEVREGG
jgi:chromatin segregation and condensation protein Rec8/ScpA/Scc1 (kleisin family)